MRKVVRLTESDLHRIVKESVYKILNIFEGNESNHIFNVIKELPNAYDFSSSINTSHWANDRDSRRNSYDDIGDGLYSFVVDTGHPDGHEIHTITDKAFIVIQNKRTKKIVTVLAARPGQIRRYWLNLNIDFPSDGYFDLVLRFAENHLGRGMNKK